MEAKDTLTSSTCLTVECLSNEIEALDAEFKEHHYAVIDLVRDDKQKLDEEQAVMNNHKDKVPKIVVRLQQLRPESKAASLAVHSTEQCIHLGKRLCCVENSLMTVNEAVEPLATRPGLNNCLQ